MDNQKAPYTEAASYQRGWTKNTSMMLQLYFVDVMSLRHVMFPSVNKKKNKRTHAHTRTHNWAEASLYKSPTCLLAAKPNSTICPHTRGAPTSHLIHNSCIRPSSGQCMVLKHARMGKDKLLTVLDESAGPCRRRSPATLSSPFSARGSGSVPQWGAGRPSPGVPCPAPAKQTQRNFINTLIDCMKKNFKVTQRKAANHGMLRSRCFFSEHDTDVNWSVMCTEEASRAKRPSNCNLTWRAFFFLEMWAIKKKKYIYI